MKTKNNEMRSRKTIIRIFSAVLLFASLAFVASSCCKDDIPEPKPEKVVIVFGVDTGEGHLEAKVDDVEIKSRTEIKKAKPLFSTPLTLNRGKLSIGKLTVWLFAQ